MISQVKSSVMTMSAILGCISLAAPALAKAGCQDSDAEQAVWNHVREAGQATDGCHPAVTERNDEDTHFTVEFRCGNAGAAQTFAVTLRDEGDENCVVNTVKPWSPEVGGQTSSYKSLLKYARAFESKQNSHNKCFQISQDGASGRTTLLQRAMGGDAELRLEFDSHTKITVENVVDVGVRYSTRNGSITFGGGVGYSAAYMVQIIGGNPVGPLECQGRP